MSIKMQRWLLLFCCVVETALYGGVMAGWRHMSQLLVGDSVYADRCNKTIPYKGEAEATSFGNVECPAQENMLELSSALSAVARALACIFAAKMLGLGEGMRTTRLLANLQIFAGGLLLFYTSKERPSLAVWGAVFVNTGGGQLFCSNLFVSDLFPRFRCFVLALICGALVYSSGIFNEFRTVPPIQRYPWQSVCYAWTMGSMLMIVPTFGLLTFQRRLKGRERSCSFVEEVFLGQAEGSSGLFPAAWSFKDLNSSGQGLGTSGVINNSTPLMSEEDYIHSKPLSSHRVKTNFLSAPFLLLVGWASVVRLALELYEGSFHRWLKETIKNDLDASLYARMFDSASTTALYVAPLVGILMDCLINYYTKKERTLRNGSASVLVTTIVILLMGLLRLEASETSLRFSLHLHAVAQPLFYVVITAIIKCWFPRPEFQDLLSFQILVTTWFCFLKYPLLMWEKENVTHATGAIVFLLSLSLLVNTWLVLPQTWLVTKLKRIRFRPSVSEL